MSLRRQSQSIHDRAQQDGFQADAPNLDLSTASTRVQRKTSSNAARLIKKESLPGARGAVHIHVSAGDSNGWPDLVVAECPPTSAEAEKRKWTQVCDSGAHAVVLPHQSSRISNACMHMPRYWIADVLGQHARPCTSLMNECRVQSLPEAGCLSPMRVSTLAAGAPARQVGVLARCCAAGSCRHHGCIRAAACVAVPASRRACRFA